jgi:hypothetical protein
MSILKPFFFGIFSALIALVFEIAYSFTPGFSFKILSQQTSLILVAFIIIEELAKFSFIWKNVSVSVEKFTKFQIFCQSLLIGLGFAITESALKSSALLPKELGEPSSYFPFFGAFIIHIGTSGLMGYLLISAKKINFWTVSQVLLVAFGWHFLFNFFIINAVNPWLIAIFLLILGFFVVLAGFKIVVMHKEKLAK